MSIISYALLIAAAGLFALNGCREVFHTNAVRMYSDKKARRVFYFAIACAASAIILFSITKSEYFQPPEIRWVWACELFIPSYVFAFYSLLIADFIGRVIGFLVIEYIYRFKTKTEWRNWMEFYWD